VASRDRPLRLLSTPITATRSAIGVSLVTGGGVGAAFLTGAAGALSVLLPCSISGESAALGSAVACSVCETAVHAIAPAAASPSASTPARRGIMAWVPPRRPVQRTCRQLWACWAC